MADLPKAVAGWDKNADVVSHVHDQSVRYLEAQLETALASDQRAVTFASIMIPTAAALVVFAVENESTALAAAALVTAGLIFAAAVLAVWSARPVDFYYPGTEPWCWWQTKHSSLQKSQANELVIIQEMIDGNAGIMNSNRAYQNWGLRLALFAPAAGLLTWRFF